MVESVSVLLVSIAAEELAKEVLVSITKEAIKQAEEKR